MRGKFTSKFSPKKSAQSGRASILQAWRGYNFEIAEREWKARGKSLECLMPKVLAGMGLQKKVAESQIIHVWQNVMDPVVTAHAQPAGLVRGTVFITVDSNTWLSELVRYRRKEILERLQHAVGSDQVQRLSFRLG